MKFTMTKVAAGILLAVAASGAQAVTVTSMSVTGGNFEMIGFGAPITFVNFGTGSADILGFDGTTPGSAVANTAFSANGIVGFGFGRGVLGSTRPTVNTYTAAANLGDVNTPAGTIPGGPAVTASAASFTDGATISVDLRSFFANYGSTDFNLGSGRNLIDGSPDGSFATGTLSNCAGNTCDYSIGWSSLIVGGAFDGNTGIWNMTGVAAVPEASTYGMMLAGLGLVWGMTRRRRISTTLPQ